MKILISGATGFIGRFLLDALLPKDHQIYALVRSIPDRRLGPDIIQLTCSTLNALDEQIDVFINLAGENIASRPWTEKRKKALFDSRVLLTNTIHKAFRYPPKCVISMSAVGFYGVAREDIFNEETPPKSGFSHELCAAWEEAAMAFSRAETRVTVLRLGVVLGVGGALEKMRLPFLCGLGGPIADGKQWFPWVHIDDVIKAIMLAMTDQAYAGAYNLVAPEQIQQKHFAKCFAAALKRPALLTTPKWALALIFGEMASLLTQGARVIPQRLEEQGFKFTFKQIDKALLDIEKRHSI
ncbi:TIGR01777 family protein [Marinomonas sp. M1K-6]|uniref:TIGR01777 family protein n=1 Tax=Marinomonas profundi TaxID=2726122 RepID=A0A847R7Y8_9GAMM|nr:TIGR01777 family oxidoreductase [Marinomonas profundi]NLQ16390.1 TIGR01777 family protein [Marinomonas profundi]UDV03037.1 TIGR01777 family oxidoreductase [Marinomonas profundi]